MDEKADTVPKKLQSRTAPRRGRNAFAAENGNTLGRALLGSTRATHGFVDDKGRGRFSHVLVHSSRNQGLGIIPCRRGHIRIGTTIEATVCTVPVTLDSQFHRSTSNSPRLNGQEHNSQFKITFRKGTRSSRSGRGMLLRSKTAIASWIISHGHDGVQTLCRTCWPRVRISTLVYWVKGTSCRSSDRPRDTA